METKSRKLDGEDAGPRNTGSHSFSPIKFEALPGTSSYFPGYVEADKDFDQYRMCMQRPK